MIIELIYEDHCGITQTKGHLLSLNKLRYKRLGMGGAALWVDDSILLATRSMCMVTECRRQGSTGTARARDNRDQVLQHAAAAVSGPPLSC